MNVSTPENSKDNSSIVSSNESKLVSEWLNSQGFDHESLDNDHLGLEQIKVDAKFLQVIAAALKSNGFDYLQCHGGYDEGPGKDLVCFYHFVAMSEKLDSDNFEKPVREVRIKVFLNREGTPTVPSLYGLYRGADWQERETFDMFGINFNGHPHPKRLLMPEDWKGWPLRKDYIQPDFYEMQDAY